MPTKKDVKYVVVAPFDFKRWYEPKEKHYEPNDEFIPSEGLSRDLTFDEFRQTAGRKHGTVSGLSFTEVGDVVSGDQRDRHSPDAERNIYRYILPVKEA